MRNKLIEILESAESAVVWNSDDRNFIERIADHLIANGVTIAAEARPCEEWHEDDGDALWWHFPIEEPPYVGSPLSEDWSASYTHWTPIVCPEPQKGTEE